MDKLKSYLLEKIPFLNMGFVGIFLDDISGRLISYQGEEVGISDKYGKYFYIREKGGEDYRVIQEKAPKIVETYQNYRLILFAENLDILETKKCILNALFFFPNIEITSCSTNIGRIITEEYPKLSHAERLAILKNINFGSLIAVDFQMRGEITPNNCECKICEEC